MIALINAETDLVEFVAAAHILRLSPITDGETKLPLTRVHLVDGSDFEAEDEPEEILPLLLRALASPGTVTWHPATALAVKS